MATIKALSRQRFDAFASYTRHPATALISEEVAWFADERETVLGVVVRDFTDDDFLFIILGRDRSRRFRCVFASEALSDVEEAKCRLTEKLAETAMGRGDVFPSGHEGR